MTIPSERANAIMHTQDFLRSLLDPKKTPRVPKYVRSWAYRCLKHYPGSFYVQEIAKLAPTYLEVKGE